MEKDSWFNRYKIPEKDLPAIGKKNIITLRVLFIIALVFGILMLVVMTGVSLGLRKQPFFILEKSFFDYILKKKHKKNQFLR